MNFLGDSGAGKVNAVRCELAAETLRESGSLRLQVTGWSMLPSIWPGDTLMINRATGYTVNPGDIVLFARDSRLFAHRVVSKTQHPGGLRITTQGDGMPRPDPALKNSELLGKISHIVRSGRLIEPSPDPSFPQRAVSALVRRSPSAARIAVGIHGLRAHSQEQPAPWQS